VHADAVRETSDVNQFAQQIDQAQGVLGKSCEVACADAGYADTEELQKIAEKGIQVVFPLSDRRCTRRKVLQQKPF